MTTPVKYLKVGNQNDTEVEELTVSRVANIEELIVENYTGTNASVDNLQVDVVSARLNPEIQVTDPVVFNGISTPTIDNSGGVLVVNDDIAISNNLLKISDTSTSITSPCHLHIQDAGDACIFLEADTNNVGESDNTFMVMTQDGNTTMLSLGANFNNNWIAQWGTGGSEDDRFKFIHNSTITDNGIGVLPSFAGTQTELMSIGIDDINMFVPLDMNTEDINNVGTLDFSSTPSLDNTATVLAVNGSGNVVTRTTFPNPFDQSLNTTDSPTFANITTTGGTGVDLSNAGALDQVPAIFVHDVFANQAFSTDVNFQNDLNMNSNDITNGGSITATDIDLSATTALRLPNILNKDGQTQLLVRDASNYIAYRNVSSLPVSNPFDQSLDTTDNVEFAFVDTPSLGSTSGTTTMSATNFAVNGGSDIQVYGPSKVDIIGTGYVNFDNTNDADFQVDDQDGFFDILGSPVVRGSGPNDPDYLIPSGFTYLYAYTFPATGGNDRRDLYFTFHIPHNWADNTQISFHTHWFTDIVPTVGDEVIWEWRYSFAGATGTSDDRFNNVESFTSATETLTGAASEQYKHFITETVDLTIPNMTVDGLIHCRMSRDRSVDGFGGNVYVLFGDAHISVNKFSTKNKVQPFYT
jgi:hypothetical protein